MIHSAGIPSLRYFCDTQTIGQFHEHTEPKNQEETLLRAPLPASPAHTPCRNPLEPHSRERRTEQDFYGHYDSLDGH